MKRFALIALLATAACGSATETDVQPVQNGNAPVVQEVTTRTCDWVDPNFKFYTFNTGDETFPNGYDNAPSATEWDVSGYYGANNSHHFTAKLLVDERGIPWVLFNADTNTSDKYTDNGDVCPAKYQWAGTYAADFKLDAESNFLVTITDTSTDTVVTFSSANEE